MANDVFANGREVSCKAADGKSICAFPDVCMTPPENPVTPPGVPVPYPNTGMASDTTGGTKTVKITGKEVMLKNKSYFKRSTGDEAGCAAKKGVITSSNMGKVYFTSWSMNVKFEGENVVRHLDLTTHNHMSMPGNTPTWPYLDSMAVSLDHPCVDDAKQESNSCQGKSKEEACEDKTCQDARKCMLVPYRKYDRQTKKMASLCCEGQTPHHLIPKSYCRGFEKGHVQYSPTRAPCICVDGKDQRTATHGQLHALQEAAARKLQESGKMTFKDVKRAAARCARWVFIESGCKSDCIEAQLDAYHNQVGISDETELTVRKILGEGEATPQDLSQIGNAIKARIRG